MSDDQLKSLASAALYAETDARNQKVILDENVCGWAQGCQTNVLSSGSEMRLASYVRPFQHPAARLHLLMQYLRCWTLSGPCRKRSIGYRILRRTGTPSSRPTSVSCQAGVPLCCLPSISISTRPAPCLSPVETITLLQVLRPRETRIAPALLSAIELSVLLVLNLDNSLDEFALDIRGGVPGSRVITSPPKMVWVIDSSTTTQLPLFWWYTDGLV